MKNETDCVQLWKGGSLLNRECEIDDKIGGTDGDLIFQN